MRLRTYSLGIAFALLPSAALAQQGTPAIPAAFYGYVEGVVGTPIIASIGGSVVGSTVIESGGVYGYAPHLFFIPDPAGNRADATIAFTIGTTTSPLTAIFKNGAVTELDFAPRPVVSGTGQGSATSTQQEATTTTPTGGGGSSREGATIATPPHQDSSSSTKQALLPPPHIVGVVAGTSTAAAEIAHLPLERAAPAPASVVPAAQPTGAGGLPMTPASATLSSLPDDTLFHTLLAGFDSFLLGATLSYIWIRRRPGAA